MRRKRAYRALPIDFLCLYNRASLMNFLILFLFLGLSVSIDFEVPREEYLGDQLNKREAFLQEKLLNIDFPSINDNSHLTKRNVDYDNVTDKVTITPW